MPTAAGAINSGDTAWVLTSTALVMLMTPGLALFYGGLVRRKNVLSTIMHSVFILALVSVTWVLFGFTLAFGKAQNRAERAVRVADPAGTVLEVKTVAPMEAAEIEAMRIGR